MTTTRHLSTIATEIRAAWTKPYFDARRIKAELKGMLR